MGSETREFVSGVKMGSVAALSSLEICAKLLVEETKKEGNEGIDVDCYVFLKRP
jgi:hypothetical protein